MCVRGCELVCTAGMPLSLSSRLSLYLCVCVVGVCV